MNLYHGDCLDYMRTMADGSVDLIVTDPPYEIAEDGGGGCFGSKSRAYHGELQAIKHGFAPEILDEMKRVLKRLNLYISCSKAQIPTLLNFFGGGYTLISWHKSNPVPTCNNKYLSDTEYCLYFREPGVKIGGTMATKSTYYVTPLNVADKKLYGHPTVKPLKIIRNFIINSSQEGDIVFDPFMGSGTTGVAALELNREFIGCEIDPGYFKTALRRTKVVMAQGRLF